MFYSYLCFSRALVYFIKGNNLNIKNEITYFGLYMSVVFVFSATLVPIRLNMAYEGF